MATSTAAAHLSRAQDGLAPRTAGTAVRPEDDTSKDRHGIDLVALRLHVLHPSCDPVVLADMVRQAMDRLREAPVQEYRFILAERQVRRQLESR